MPGEEKAMPETPQCPHCGRPCEPDAVLCTRCGTDLRTGRPLYVNPEPADTDAEDSVGPGMRLLQRVGDLAPGLFSPTVMLAAIVVGLAGLGIIALGIVLFLWGVLIGAFAVAAAGLICYAQAIAMVLYGGFSWLPEMLADFDSPRWTVFFILVSLPIVALTLLFRPMMS
jgi:hypothetical protein